MLTWLSRKLKNGPDDTCVSELTSMTSALCLLCAVTVLRPVLQLLLRLGLRLQSGLLSGNGTVRRDSEKMLCGKVSFSLLMCLVALLVLTACVIMVLSCLLMPAIRAAWHGCGVGGSRCLTRALTLRRTSGWKVEWWPTLNSISLSLPVGSCWQSVLMTVRVSMAKLIIDRKAIIGVSWVSVLSCVRRLTRVRSCCVISEDRCVLPIGKSPHPNGPNLGMTLSYVVPLKCGSSVG